MRRLGACPRCAPRTRRRSSPPRTTREPAQQHWPWLKNRAKCDPSTACVHVGVGEDDVRALAAEFERDALQVRFGGGFHDEVPDLGGTGERDLVDVHVPREGRAGGGAVAGQDVHDAFGEAGFQNQLADAQGRQRRLLGGLSARPCCRRPVPAPSFHACISSGKFQGMIWPTTPTGSWRV